MMSDSLDLSQVGPAFADPVRDSQSAFRRLMDAVARPGEEVRFDHSLEVPGGLCLAAAASALTLFDFETRVWIDPALGARPAEAWLRFHCGCPLTVAPLEAAFALVVDLATAPALSAFNAGDAKYPDRSTTVIIQLASLSGGRRVRLRGPGIKGERMIAPNGLPSDFWAQVQDNNAQFQFGIDLLLVEGNSLIALPRSTQIQFVEGD
jgi:alpha-D-ribose 1-methylphosphonate 5-triphosphate synthase subunit PhnH